MMAVKGLGSLKGSIGAVGGVCNSVSHGPSRG